MAYTTGQTQFYAIDGEAYTKDNDHKYVLLAGSDGKYIYDANGLGTIECFDHLLSLSKRRRILVCFGLNYDANMIFRDMPEGKLRELHTERSVYWSNYFIEYIPRKWLTIKNTKTKQTVKIYEVFGYFQTSFIKALTAWNLEPPREIVEGKQLRSDFTEEQFKQILSYCIRECELLVQLMNSLKSAMLSVDIKPRTWCGAGTVAAALLKPVRPFHLHDIEHPTEVLDSIYMGYFGGRVELYKQGQFPKIHNYDIISAYPSEIRNLPDLASGKWSKRRVFTNKYPGVWRVKWNNTQGPIAPFPVRYKKEIYYPTSGEGTYHTAEVSAAIDSGFKIQIVGGWTYHPTSDFKPFQFIDELFEYRKKLKQAGHPGEKAVKLGLNSVYGKLAQGQGYRGQLPAFQSYFWAGQVTAATRAQLLRAIMSNPEAMVMVATDGIFSEDELPLELGTKLGEWETQEYDDMFTAQPGVYKATVDGKPLVKSRGFFAREVDYDALIQGWKDDREYASYHYTSTRFIGLGTALSRTSMKDWRTWVSENRRIGLYPNRRNVGTDYGYYIEHSPPPRICKLSEPYVPKSDKVALDILEEINQGMDQPLASEV